MLNARHNKDKHNGPGLSGWMHSVSGAPSWLQCPSPILPCSPLHTGWLCTVSFVSEHALQLFWLEAVETLCLCACLLRFCVVYSACTCSMQHAACLSTCHSSNIACNTNCPEAASRWRVDFISINALLSYTSPPPAIEKETRLLHIAK